MNATQLRKIADGANQAKSDALEKKVQGQLAAFYAFLEVMAKKGAYEATYRQSLCLETQKRLRADGIKIQDVGDHVANIYNVSWGK